MTSHVAFLRGINVGGHRVKMDHLRALFEELDVSDVWTFIASGNVGFEAAAGDESALSEAIESHLRESLGYDVATFLRTPEELLAITRFEPEPRPKDGEFVSHYVMLLNEPAPASLRSALAEITSDYDDFQYDEREIHWRMRGKLTDSPLFGGTLEKAMRGFTNTSRNMTTLRRLVAKVGA
ncbi:MAG: DUF1697 domain-containing protein [Gemmatimonadota bacterium]|nr:DUF1697 domain-containing protein [Gemmatimonadota bacterium]